jgi:hypothetical protein
VLCVAASVRRLAWAIAPTGIQHRTLLASIGQSRGAEARAKLTAGLDRYGPARGQWERALVVATAEPDETTRSARINEQLTELEVLSERWDSVPRVCARLTSSAGFLCATVALLEALAPGEDETRDLHASLWTAVGALVAGVVAAGVCAAVHLRARTARAEAAQAADRLVEGLATAD